MQRLPSFAKEQRFNQACSFSSSRWYLDPLGCNAQQDCKACCVHAGVPLGEGPLLCTGEPPKFNSVEVSVYCTVLETPRMCPCCCTPGMFWSIHDETSTLQHFIIIGGSRSVYCDWLCKDCGKWCGNPAKWIPKPAYMGIWKFDEFVSTCFVFISFLGLRYLQVLKKGQSNICEPKAALAWSKVVLYGNAPWLKKLSRQVTAGVRPVERYIYNI